MNRLTIIKHDIYSSIFQTLDVFPHFRQIIPEDHLSLLCLSLSPYSLKLLQVFVLQVNE